MSATDLADAVMALVELPWEDLGSHLTCYEAEEAYAALVALGHAGKADDLMVDHAGSDDDEDDRHRLVTTIITDGGTKYHSYRWERVDACSSCNHEHAGGPCGDCTCTRAYAAAEQD